MRSKQNPRSKKARRARQFRTLICLACACVILAGALYTAAWIQNRNRIEKEAQLYQQMYAPASDEATLPPSTPPETPSAEPVSTPDVLPEVNDLPIPTPDADTQILTLPSAPPAQDSFEAVSYTHLRRASGNRPEKSQDQSQQCRLFRPGAR